MFAGCAVLETLDLSAFNTAKVSIMKGMFENCKALITIYVGSGWTTKNVTSSDRMFIYCSNLVGGSGTKYSGPYDKTYACVDEATYTNGVYVSGQKGFLTYKKKSTE
jgi:surface protein